MNRFVSGAAIAACIFMAARPLRAEVREASEDIEGITVSYKVVLPDNYDASRTYPGVLVFGGGPQTMNTIDRALDRNFRAEAEKRGYIVIGVAAPNGQLFFQGGERIIPQFLDRVMARYRIADRKFHAAGPSNGGIASFHVAAAYPQYFKSVTAFPGYMWRPSTAKLDAIADMCVFMYVGEFDEYRWHGEMEREAEYLRSKGTLARYTVEEDQHHGIATLRDEQAGRLFDDFELTAGSCKR
jgi:poly(3-hydroxybutyrate) depolymerase